MVVQSFTLPQGNCPVGQKTASSSAVLNDNPKSVTIRLTSTQWAAKTGLGSVRWGLERSPDGTVWEEWLFQSRDMGSLDRDGGLPWLSATGGAMVDMVGWRGRLFAEPTGTDIQLGAMVTVTN